MRERQSNQAKHSMVPCGDNRDIAALYNTINNISINSSSCKATLKIYCLELHYQLSFFSLFKRLSL